MTATTTTSTASASAAPAAVPRPTTLDELAALDVATLEQVYRAAQAPASLHALDGNPICRMLSIRGLDRGPVARLLRGAAASDRFPWAGKSFRATDDARGGGINRVRLLGGKRWFPFDTRVEPSAIDGAPCVFLDYDRAPNPRAIRAIRDELREVVPGLFLGPAMLDTKQSPPRLVLWFACDARGPRA